MAFTAADVKNLREMTGVGMMDCKKALTASDGDMDKAVEFLREKGLAASAEEGWPHCRRGHGLRRCHRRRGRGCRGQRRDRLRGQEREVRGLCQGCGRYRGRQQARRPGGPDGLQVQRHRPDCCSSSSRRWSWSSARTSRSAASPFSLRASPFPISTPAARSACW